jgi:hypothetical protein
MSFDADKPIGVDNLITVPLPERHCGRCQRAFPGDPTLFFQTDWALCPACEAILLPRRPAASASGQSPGSVAATATPAMPRL